MIQINWLFVDSEVIYNNGSIVLMQILFLQQILQNAVLVVTRFFITANPRITNHIFGTSKLVLESVLKPIMDA